MPVSSFDVPQYFFYAADTTPGILIKDSSGRLVSMTLSNISNSALVTLYNAKSAINPIWTGGPMGANTVPFTVDFGHLIFDVGLFMTVSGAGAGVTVVYE